MSTKYRYFLESSLKQPLKNRILIAKTNLKIFNQ